MIVLSIIGLKLQTIVFTIMLVLTMAYLLTLLEYRIKEIIRKEEHE